MTTVPVQRHVVAVGRYRGVLLDWRGILVHDPEPSWWVTRALERLGRVIEPVAVEAAVTGLAQAATDPDVLAAEQSADCSPEQNREAEMLRFERAGLDAKLAEALYELDFEPESHPVYPDVPEVLAAIRARGIRTALVSDIHFDLRGDLAAHGIAQLFDAYVLSYEPGFQKPDPRMFRLALEALGIEAGDALMVGDRASHDGGAAAVGIDTLILPMPKTFGPRGLDRILRLVG